MTVVGAADLIGKQIIGDQTGRKFGIVKDVLFVSESGELLNLVVEQPTRHLEELNLNQDDKGNPLIPFTAVKSIGDFVIVSEADLI